ncbi:virulence-associated protein E [Pseudomonas sp. D47]|uniref:virulence-associated protein E n=1 Tax=Pseudomonas sp. D47 TaxID=3159447 RepID=UPI00387AC13E
MTPIDSVLNRLDQVKINGKGRWKACCPAHADKSPSLGITETSDGTVLLKCWVGCSALDITQAIGLELRDLFPGEKRERRGPSPAAVRHERLIYQIGKNLNDQGTEMSPADLERFNLAKQRLGVEE